MDETIEILNNKVKVFSVSGYEADVDFSFGDTFNPCRNNMCQRQRNLAMLSLRETVSNSPNAMTTLRAYRVEDGVYVYGQAEKSITNLQLLCACANAISAPNAGGHVLRNASGRFEVFVFLGDKV